MLQVLQMIKQYIMNNNRFVLEQYHGMNSRYTCPKCGKPHEFSRYIDTETGEMLAEHIGKCNRIDKCGYHYTPKQYFADTGTKPENITPPPYKQPTRERHVSYIDTKTFNDSLKGYDTNNLIKYLDSLFDAETVVHLINIYKIGTSSRYGGGTTVFWQIDYNDKIRAGKLIKYATNGHRVHGKQNWTHAILNIDNFNLKQCLFGEHILKHTPDAVVAIVESEKTAIIACAFMPQYVWLATGGAENLNEDKVKVLRGRKVILFPDASKEGKIYKKWKAKAEKFNFKISDLLEREAIAEQKEAGVDIADFLIKQKWKHHEESCDPIEKTPVKASIVDEPVSPIVNEPESEPKPLQENWDNSIIELEQYFKATALPTKPIKLNDWTTIIDPKQFVNDSLITLKRYNGNRYFQPCLNNLLKFKSLISRT